LALACGVKARNEKNADPRVCANWNWPADLESMLSAYSESIGWDVE